MLQSMNPEEVLTSLILSLVDCPEQVSVDAHVNEHVAVFTVSCADEDVGKLLGKHGAYANAIRTLFTAVYGKLGKQLTFHVVDPRTRH